MTGVRHHEANTRCNASRLLVFGAALCVATSGMTAAAAASPRPIDSPRPDASRGVKATGTYEASFPVEHSNSRLVIKADKGVSTKEGTFKLTDFGDSGTWLLSGKTISLLVTSAPTTNHFGRLFIGTVTTKAITSATYTNSDGQPEGWSATRGATAAPRAGRRPPVERAAGSYAITFSGGGPPTSLALKHDAFSDLEGTATTDTVDYTDSGVWIVAGNQFAMGLTGGPDFGDVFIGTLTASGIGNGALAVLGEGVFGWSATRNATCDSTFTVDVLDGKDTNSGTCAAPFKTLTKGLSVATSGETIDVEPGLYDPPTETFHSSFRPGSH